MCRLFSDALERTTLWDKIGASLMAAHAKAAATGDLERFVSDALEGVKASEGAAARDEGLLALLDTVAVWPVEVRQRFLDYVASRRFVVLSLARRRWEEFKTAHRGGPQP